MHIIDKILVANRIDYSKEMKVVINALVEFIDDYKARGYEVVLLFLGDIFHRGYTDPSASIDGNNLLIYLSQKVSAMYTVVGNHELTTIVTILSTLSLAKQTQEGLKGLATE